jgi:hypothetical protein
VTVVKAPKKNRPLDVIVNAGEAGVRGLTAARRFDERDGKA